MIFSKSHISITLYTAKKQRCAKTNKDTFQSFHLFRFGFAIMAISNYYKDDIFGCLVAMVQKEKTKFP
jgi:hypothetical protein